MAIAGQNNRREGNRWRNHHGRGNTEPAKIRGSGNDGRWDITLRHESAPQGWRNQRFAGLNNLSWNEFRLFHSGIKRSQGQRRIMMNIYVGNLSYDVTDEMIREAFGSFGEVTSARVIKDKYSGQSRGFGFVEMPEQSQAQAAIKSLHGKELLGKQISVSEARPRTGDRNTRGGRMEDNRRRSRY